MWLKSSPEPHKGAKEFLRKLVLGYELRLARLKGLEKEKVGILGNEQLFIVELLFGARYNPHGLVARTAEVDESRFANGLWFVSRYRSRFAHASVVLNNAKSGARKGVRALVPERGRAPVRAGLAARAGPRRPRRGARLRGRADRRGRGARSDGELRAGARRARRRRALRRIARRRHRRQALGLRAGTRRGAQGDARRHALRLRRARAL